jgi:hypothetical protein
LEISDRCGYWISFYKNEIAITLEIEKRKELFENILKKYSLEIEDFDANRPEIKSAQVIKIK